jgi:hypothetical protein
MAASAHNTAMAMSEREPGVKLREAALRTGGGTRIRLPIGSVTEGGIPGISSTVNCRARLSAALHGLQSSVPGPVVFPQMVQLMRARASWGTMPMS